MSKFPHAKISHADKLKRQKMDANPEFGLINSPAIVHEKDTMVLKGSPEVNSKVNIEKLRKMNLTQLVEVLNKTAENFQSVAAKHLQLID